MQYYAENGGNAAQYQVFWEVVPEDKYEQQPPQFFGVAQHGDLMFIHVTLSAGDALFHIVDETQHVDKDYHYVNSAILPDGHAEFIAENPEFNNAWYDLGQWNALEFTGAQVASPTTGWESIGNSEYYELYMQDSAHVEMAYPDGIDDGDTGYDFPERWVNYGNGTDSTC